ncbi:MAG TPA: hypothetical protein VFL76_08710 [Edaphocola sp.]|nr:hypothetical protein [Edaphocola sp.]
MSVAKVLFFLKFPYYCSSFFDTFLFCENESPPLFFIFLFCIAILNAFAGAGFRMEGKSIKNAKPGTKKGPAAKPFPGMEELY